MTTSEHHWWQDNSYSFPSWAIWFAFVFWIGVGVVLIGGGSVLGFHMDRMSCRNTASVMQLPWKHSISTGCLIRYDGYWQSPEQLRFMQGVDQEPPE